MTTDGLALVLGVALLVIIILLPYYSIRINHQLTSIRDLVREIRNKLP